MNLLLDDSLSADRSAQWWRTDAAMHAIRGFDTDHRRQRSVHLFPRLVPTLDTRLRATSRWYRSEQRGWQIGKRGRCAATS